jgi:ActR/RegA family two-component response regulator
MPQTSTISYANLASSTQVQTTAAALQARGFNVQVVDTAAQALVKVQELIPTDSKIMTGGS